MTPKIIFKNKSVVDVVFSINVADLASLLAERSDQIEGKRKRGRPRTVSSETIAEILAMKASGKFSQKTIAEKFNLSAYTVSRICTNTYLPDLIQIEGDN